jgi:signal transduction histidine kinase/ligand-binding sensor domain-containing protein
MMSGLLRVSRQLRQALYLMGVLLAISHFGHAEQLPVRNYTTADGLPRDHTTLIRQDSRGFIWIVAGDGISRFDGYKFRNYTTDDGLADRRVNDLLETRAGVYWMATESGLCRFNPTGKPVLGSKDAATIEQDEFRSTIEPMFVVYNPTEKPIAFNALLEDERGAIWCATRAGLYRLQVRADGEAEFQPFDLGAPEREADKNATALLKDRKGFLWVGTWGGAVYRLAPDGRVEHYALGERGLPWIQVGDDRVAVHTLFEDRDGRIWAGTRGTGLHKLVAEPVPSRPLVERTYTYKDGLPLAWITALHQTRDGKLWVATSSGLCLATPANDGGALSFQIYDAKNGLCDGVGDVFEDRDGNLWLATKCNTMRVARNGFTGYGAADGFPHAPVNSIFEDRDGALTVISRDDSKNSRRVINRFDGARFNAVAPNLPSYIAYHGWGGWQTIIQDRTGEWWIPTGYGLHRFPKVERIEQLSSVKQKAFYILHGLAAYEPFRVYEDARGDVWMGISGLRFGLVRWERATNTLHDHTAETGVPPDADFSGFAEDLRGNLWIGTGGEGGRLLRYRDGKFKLFTIEDGVPPGWIIWFYLDRMGRLWIGSQLGGLNRIDDPGAETPRFVRYTTRDGLSSNNVRSITEDLWGRIYVGTGHGVDRLDLETGNVKHYTVADGLPRGIIEHAYRDRHGALWFGTPFGLSRLVPERQESGAPPSIYITGLRVEGARRRISELGETKLPELELASAQNEVSVDFVGLGATVGEELRYQYVLEGAGEGWSAPTTERTINFASLAPGSYRFMVRAMSADGQLSQTPATFSFRIAAPVWKRWYFWTAIALTVGLAAFMLYRYRVAQLLQVANTRMRIATDLHDDIGSGLSRVAILSEVVKQQVGAGGAEQSVPLLNEIADSARSLVGSMRDIVWAIDPRQDDLGNVVSRVRQFASDVLEPQNIKCDFQVQSDLERIKLDPEQRRHLFLIFKEALHNIARHADCDYVSLSITTSHHRLTAEIYDDGRGFIDTSSGQVATNGRTGHGLENMQHRAAQLGGHLTIDSSPGRGTRLKLTVPLKKR